jgi:hypothetical protein
MKAGQIIALSLIGVALVIGFVVAFNYEPATVTTDTNTDESNGGGEFIGQIISVIGLG